MPRRVIGSSLSGRIWHMLKVIRNIIFKHPQWTLFICAVFVRTSSVFFGDFVWLNRPAAYNVSPIEPHKITKEYRRSANKNRTDEKSPLRVLKDDVSDNLQHMPDSTTE